MGRIAALCLLACLPCCSLNMKGSWMIPPEDVSGADDGDRDVSVDTGEGRDDLSADDPAVEPPAETPPEPGEDVGPAEDVPADIEPEDPPEEGLDVRDAIDAEIIGVDATDAAEEIVCGNNRIEFEAEAMELIFFIALDDPRVGQYITDPAGFTGFASIELDIPCAVHWLEGDSFYWAWDDPTSTLVWHLLQQCGDPRVDEWRWDQVSGSIETWDCGDVGDDPAVVSLTAGPHTFYLLGREAYARVDKFIITDNLSWTGP
jgi:hypothetical protein